MVNYAVRDLAHCALRISMLTGDFRKDDHAAFPAEKCALAISCDVTDRIVTARSLCFSIVSYLIVSFLFYRVLAYTSGLSIYLFVCLSACLSVYLSLSFSLSLSLSISLSLSVYICISVYVSIYPCIFLCIHLSVCICLHM